MCFEVNDHCVCRSPDYIMWLISGSKNRFRGCPDSFLLFVFLVGILQIFINSVAFTGKILLFSSIPSSSSMGSQNIMEPERAMNHTQSKSDGVALGEAEVCVGVFTSTLGFSYIGGV